jgi:diadenosine tetraphosphate (Ap4A) HIT family hydrolase
MNATIEKFGYPASLIREYDHWVLLLRPSQVTAGSLILASKSDATAYGALPTAAFAEQASIVAELEAMLKSSVDFEKINYLMLMMVDRHVHFHIFPRYEGRRSLAGISFPDVGWPGPPDLKSAVECDGEWQKRAIGLLRTGQ